MANQSFQHASLDDSKLDCLRGLERQLGKVLVALEPRATLAALSDVELAHLKEAEQQLSVVLVAYEGA